MLVAFEMVPSIKVYLLQSNVTLYTAVNTSGKAAILMHTPIHTSASLLTLVH